MCVLYIRQLLLMDSRADFLWQLSLGSIVWRWDFLFPFLCNLRALCDYCLHFFFSLNIFIPCGSLLVVFIYTTVLHCTCANQYILKFCTLFNSSRPGTVFLNSQNSLLFGSFYFLNCINSFSVLSPILGWVPFGVESILGWVPFGVKSILGWVPFGVKSHSV